MRYFAYIEHFLVVLVALAMFFVLYGLLAIPMSFINPVKRAIEDFSLSDLYYAVDWNTPETPQKSDYITLIDITKMTNRAEIAQMLDKVKLCEPAVIGVDIIFEGCGHDSVADKMLDSVATNMPNTVFASKLVNYDEANNNFDDMVKPYFVNDSTCIAYVNTVSEAYSTCLRSLSIERKCKGKPAKSFTATVAEKFAKGLLPNNSKLNYFINFRHLDFITIAGDSIQENSDKLKGRIVLIGTLSKEEDSHFTPLGMMPGLKVQAYSVQTLIDHRNIATLNTVWYFFVVAILTYITVVWQFLWIRSCKKFNKPIMFFIGESKLVLRLLTFLWMAFLAWIAYILYNKADIYVSFGAILVCIVLVGEARGVYTAMLKTAIKAHWRTDKLPHSIYLEG